MNERRKSLVGLAFKILDTDRSGEIDIRDIRQVYNASSHPDVVAGRKTSDEILEQFMQSFQVGKVKDNIITLSEFEDYYSTISASIDSDDYFELMIRNAWHISGGEGQYANTTNRRILVTHADGRQTVEEIKNDIGISAKNTDAMMANLKKQGLNVATINLTGIDDMGHQIENKEYFKNRPSGNQAEGQLYIDAGNVGSSSVNSGQPSAQRQNLAAFANNLNTGKTLRVNNNGMKSEQQKPLSDVVLNSKSSGARR